MSSFTMESIFSPVIEPRWNLGYSHILNVCPGLPLIYLLGQIKNILYCLGLIYILYFRYDDQRLSYDCFFLSEGLCFVNSPESLIKANSPNTWCMLIVNSFMYTSHNPEQPFVIWDVFPLIFSFQLHSMSLASHWSLKLKT